MPKFSDSEKELITDLGIEAFKFLLNVYKASKAKGQDLQALLEKAEQMNDLDIDQIGV